MSDRMTSVEMEDGTRYDAPIGVSPDEFIDKVGWAHHLGISLEEADRMIANCRAGRRVDDKAKSRSLILFYGRSVPTYTRQKTPMKACITPLRGTRLTRTGLILPHIQNTLHLSLNLSLKARWRERHLYYLNPLLC